MLCVGGAREALLAQPNHFEIVLGMRLVSSRLESCLVKTGSVLTRFVVLCLIQFELFEVCYTTVMQPLCSLLKF